MSTYSPEAILAMNTDAATRSVVSRLLSTRYLFVVLTLLSIYLGWSLRDEFLWSAEFGFGYGLGIGGGLMMLLLLIYPLRKRFHHSSFFILSTKNWFKLHMVLGILGPLAILYHCNFSLGSINSNVALFSMLLMTTSGLVGRFIYSRIHHGLYGEKVRFNELKNILQQIKAELDKDLLVDIEASEGQDSKENFIDELGGLELLITPRRGLLANFLRIIQVGLVTRVQYIVLQQKLRNRLYECKEGRQISSVAKKRHITAFRKHLSLYFSTVRKIAGLSFYERLFSLWHMLHLPIFFMLIITGFAHVYAVHAY